MRLPQNSRLPYAALWKASGWLILTSRWLRFPRATTRSRTGSVRCSQSHFQASALQTSLRSSICQRVPCAITSPSPRRNWAHATAWKRHDLLSRRDGCRGPSLLKHHGFSATIKKRWSCKDPLAVAPHMVYYMGGSHSRNKSAKNERRATTRLHITYQN